MASDSKPRVYTDIIVITLDNHLVWAVVPMTVVIVVVVVMMMMVMMRVGRSSADVHIVIVSFNNHNILRMLRTMVMVVTVMVMMMVVVGVWGTTIVRDVISVNEGLRLRFLLV